MATEYLTWHVFCIWDCNVARKTSELGLVAEKEEHTFIEVKTMLADEFPDPENMRNDYDPH
ncbi:MAG: hypothetical protein ACYC75_03005 [Minisyncoccota bacterium]